MDKNVCSVMGRNFQLQDPASVVRCSSVLKKSISGLDLSTLEYTFYKRVIASTRKNVFDFLKVFFNSEEKVKKFLLANRKILYSYHLDLPQGSEPRMRDAENFEFMDAISFKRGGFISLPSYWYAEKIQHLVIQSVKSSKEKLGTLSQILKNELSYDSYFETSLYVVRYDFRVLCFNIDEKNTSKGVIVSFDVTENSHSSTIPNVSEIHTYGGFQAQGLIEKKVFIIHEMVVDCVFEFVPSLVRNGFDLYFNEGSYKDFSHRMEDLLEEDDAELITERMNNTRRSYLLLQALHIACFVDEYPELGDDALEVLCLIWRSIPDPVLSRCEVQHAFQGVLGKEYLKWFDIIYESSVEEFPEKPQPRSLKHLARVSVRRTLSNNQKFPDGLDQIGILPPPVLSLLRLEE